jgi:hypothetical protein
MREAGALPRDALDTFFVDTATTFDQLKAHAIAVGASPP